MVKTSRRGPASIIEPVDLGTAALVPDRDRPDGWTLLVDGVAQSHVDLADPTYLEFEYMRKLASVVDAAAPSGAPLRVLHLGGGALSLPRYVAATRPGSRQRVVERDAALTALVRRVLPLPRGADLRVRTADARAAVEGTRAGVFDLVVADVYRGAQMPRTVSSTEFVGHVARILRPDGLYAVNVADLPPLAFSRIQAATLRAVFPDVCVVAEAGTLRGRRYGNVILVAALRPGGLPVDRLSDAARRDAFPARLLHGADLDRFISGAQPMTDEAAQDSPKPPPGLLT
ncbi:spermidine synthase [Planosporangium sp. 12N6]|uniref:spermidine synthase n=1 Tax=Planosporangium spinosum TaxID=3402278 RepID=UPI003CE6A47C